jgi:hypothetical protein
VPESRIKSEPKPDPEPKDEAREPRALSSEYHKARKQLMLWAGILFIWELVGIDLEKAKEAGGNFGAIIGAIKSPQAVPWALLILVGYFAFKLRIEWRQCNVTRRQVREARIDYYSACIVAGAACSLYFGQAISRVQFANAVQGSDKVESVFAGISLCLLIASVARLLRNWRSRKRKSEDSLVSRLVDLPPAVATLGMFLLFWSRGRSLRWFLVGLLLSSIILGLVPLASIYVQRSRAALRK